MKDDKTKYSKGCAFWPTLISFIILILIFVFSIKIFLDEPSLINALPFLSLFVLIIYGIKGIIKGTLKGKIEVSKENKHIKRTNPYVYYRELPNNFGIGVNSLLIDSTLENYKDIVAVILDLCARKYLSLVKQNDKYIVKILKPIDDNLLSNERYILDLIMNNKIKQINYRTWYNYCMQDGISLGLYFQKKVKVNEVIFSQNEIDNINNACIRKSIIVGFIILIFLLFNEQTSYTIFGHVFLSVLWSFCGGIIMYPILSMLEGVKSIFKFGKRLGKQAEQTCYNNVRENNFVKTEKGINELHKLMSFKYFLSDFGNFVNKRVEEVALWDRYLSYAQVFGLTNEIMKSGYEQLVNNSSFQIDDINNINLYNIDLQ